MIDTMMAKSANVEDVLEMFSRYNLEWMSKAQMFIVDKSGDSAIVEGDTVVRNCDAYQVISLMRKVQVTLRHGGMLVRIRIPGKR